MWASGDSVLLRLSSWRWKDEEEVRDAVAVGRFTTAQVAELP